MTNTQWGCKLQTIYLPYRLVSTKVYSDDQLLPYINTTPTGAVFTFSDEMSLFNQSAQKYILEARWTGTKNIPANNS